MRLLQSLAQKVPESMTTNVRNKAIIDHAKAFIETESTILDVGCGMGKLSLELSDAFQAEVTGIDIEAYPKALIHIQTFNGRDIPFEENAFDYVLMADVLHHSHHAESLINQALAIAKKGVVIKDHYYKSLLGKMYLKAMDTLGNIADGVDVIDGYYSLKDWEALIARHGGKSVTWNGQGLHQIMLFLPQQGGV